MASNPIFKNADFLVIISRYKCLTALLLPSSEVIPRTLSTEMGMFPFNFCFILWLGLHTYTYHLEVIYVVDYMIYGFHFRVINGRHYKIFVARAGTNLVGLGMVP